MTKKEYSELKEFLARMDERQKTILMQVKKTNGRVQSLERWRTVITTTGSVIIAMVTLQWVIAKDLLSILN